MKWLIWREYRLNRPILITGAVLLLLPYLVILIALCWPNAPAMGARHVARAFAGAAIYNIVLSQLTVLVLGGNAIAGERADRSAEFIAYLPLPRTRRLSSKLILAFSAAALIWGINLLVLWILVSAAPQFRSGPNLPPDIPLMLSYVAITGLVFYGVSWLISSFQSSPTFAVGGGLITPILVLMGLHAAAWAMDLDAPSIARFAENGYAIICPMLALVGFSIGTWYYLTRIEP